ncbi:MAG TPA: hypothetical protein VMS17_17735 [Gemmataceae bacterium]|nr:hypothetical protein [Gemmataceae bacterium]
MKTAAVESGFLGWWRPRPGVAWTRLAEGPDYDAALSAQLDALRSMRGGGDSLVLRAADDPNAPRRPYVRRLL